MWFEALGYVRFGLVRLGYVRLGLLRFDCFLVVKKHYLVPLCAFINMPLRSHLATSNVAEILIIAGWTKDLKRTNI